MRGLSGITGFGRLAATLLATGVAGGQYFKEAAVNTGLRLIAEPRRVGPGRKTLDIWHKRIGQSNYSPEMTNQPFTCPEGGRAARRRAMREQGEMRFQRLRPPSAAEIAFEHKRKRRIRKLAGATS